MTKSLPHIDLFIKTLGMHPVFQTAWKPSDLAEEVPF